MLLLSLWWVAPIEAQLNVLTVREAESLVELVPDVAASQQRGECPVMSPGYTKGVDLDIWVRTTCGTGRGMLVGAYTVDRWTGAVKTWGDNPVAVADARGTAAAAKLVQQARERILSSSEARCLALTAARSLQGWGGGDAVISVNPLDGPASPSGRAEAREGVLHFTAIRSLISKPVEVGRLLTVSLTEARVRDEETGLDVMSSAVGDLTAKLLELREPVWISDEEAALVALVLPSTEASLKNGCKLSAGMGVPYSHQTLISVVCKDGAERGSNMVVNLETGMVTDPNTRNRLDTDATRRIARQLLSNAQERRTDLQKVVAAVCVAQ